MFGKYRVLSTLGTGNSSTVYLAEHIRLNVYRAIKCIPKDTSLVSSPSSEATLLKDLNHPGIPIIYDIEEDEHFFYIIEEFIQGQSIDTFVSYQKISHELLIKFGIQLCDILDYLHHLMPYPILYQDLKPEHIIVCGNQIKLIDFGIASYITSRGKNYQNYGTKGFAAPEQYGLSQSDGRADIYALGVLLNIMLTGEHPSRKLAGGRMGEVGQVHRGRDEAVEERHDDSGRDRDADPLGRYFLRTFQHFPVRHAVEHDRHDDEEDKQRLAFRLAEVVDQHAQHERQSDTYRKGYRQPADRDGGRQQDVGGVEHDAAQKGAAEAVPVGLSQIGQKAASLASDAAEREGRQNREQQYADHVVPVEKLVTPGLAGEFLGVSPRAPAEHRDEAEDDCQRVAVNNEHSI